MREFELIVGRAYRTRDSQAGGILARELFSSAPELMQRLRIAADISQTEMSRALGVEQSACSKWESGDRLPRPEHARAYLQNCLYSDPLRDIGSRAMRQLAAEAEGIEELLDGLRAAIPPDGWALNKAVSGR